MKYILNEYEPNSLFRFFEEICAIPHGSGNESAIADYLCRFAKENGLYCYRDAIHNVLIKKPGSAGYENMPAVLLQGHTDMVCEKNADTMHDFEKDSLKLNVKEGWLYAEGTTLGADDGVAVALMMAILENKTAIHPPLECLFTVQEETGMGGAFGFDYSLITAKRFINLDGSLHSATVSCAGGCRTDMTFTFEPYKLQNSPIKIAVKGLSGGHSGMDINTGRENANIIMGKLLCMLYEKMPFNLISINGGNKANAITRECECIISVFDKKEAKAVISEFAAKIKKTLVKEDKKFTVRVENIKEKPEYMFCFKDTSRVVTAINLMPNGVNSMSRKMSGLVESSSNLGIIETKENTVNITAMPRSSSEIKLDEIICKFDLLGKAVGASVSHHERYPGWEYRQHDSVRDLYIKEYNSLFGHKPNIEAIHAGVECGIICSELGGNIEGVSIGAEALEIHTPDERLNLKSFSDSYLLVTEMLKNI